MPGQGAFQEVNQHIDYAFEIVPAALLDAQMAVDGCVARGSGETFVVLVGDVFAVFLDVLLGEAEVDDENPGTVLVRAHEKVLRLYVSVHEFSRVHILQPTHDLLPHTYHCPQIELPPAPLEQVLQGGAQKVHHHNVVLLVLAEVVEPWQTHLEGRNALIEVGQQFGLILELMVLGLDWFQLDCHYLLGGAIEGVVYLAKGTPSDSPQQLVLLSHHHLLHNITSKVTSIITVIKGRVDRDTNGGLMRELIDECDADMLSCLLFSEMGDE